MTFSGRRGWNQAKSVVDDQVRRTSDASRSPTSLERVMQLQDQVEELTRIITAQADVDNQTTELLGRLLATSSARLDAVEDSLPDSQAAKPAPGSAGSANGRPPAKTEGKTSASGDKQS